LLPYGHHEIDDDDIRAVLEALRSDWVTQGPLVPAFERELAACVGAGHAVAVSSGTSALHAAIHALGIGPGDEVITTPLTFVASANCILYEGGRPTFADVRGDTLNIDPAAVERAVTPRTRAVLAVHFAGQPADLDELRRVALAHGLQLIEDAAHALGATYNDRPVGSISPLTVFSFHPVKHVTTGEGGAITTHDAALAERMQAFRTHGITQGARERQEQGVWFYEMSSLGYNYRITDLQCALGISQLRKRERFLERRRELARRYDDAFAHVDAITVPAVRPNVRHARHIYPVLLNLEMLTVDRGEVFATLREANIGVSVHYIPVHLHAYYRDRFGHGPGDLPVAERAYDRLLTLPLFPSMTDADLDYVVTVLTTVLGQKRR
jgi:perosamine synthetase